MKNLIFLSIALSFTANAATTDTLQLKGTVAQSISIDVAGETIASDLPLDVTQTNTKIASVTEQSNSNTGFTVSISSANEGKLIRDGGSEEFGYSLAYDGSALDLSSTAELTRSSAAAVKDTNDLTISYTGVDEEDMVAGDYTDTLTFSIAAN